MSATASGIAGAGAAGWSMLREDVSPPAAVRRRSALRPNPAWMRGFTAACGVQLAAHGKTTMRPELFRLQLESGAWSITVATTPQARKAWLAGARHILVVMADPLRGKAHMAPWRSEWRVRALSRRRPPACACACGERRRCLPA